MDYTPEEQQNLFKIVMEIANKNFIELYSDVVIDDSMNLVIEFEDIYQDETVKIFENDIRNTISDYNCPSNSKCPLASVLSENPDIGSKWGDNKGECVKVLNESNASCARCPPGTYVDYSNITNICTKCPPNTFSDTFNTLECKPCNGAKEGSSRCLEDPNANKKQKCGNQWEDLSTINILDPTLKNEEIISKLYDNNVRKFKQNETLKYRLRKLESKVKELQDL